jgi:hypothetical protein
MGTTGNGGARCRHAVRHRFGHGGVTTRKELDTKRNRVFHGITAREWGNSGNRDCDDRDVPVYRTFRPESDVPDEAATANSRVPHRRIIRSSTATGSGPTNGGGATSGHPHRLGVYWGHIGGGTSHGMQEPRIASAGTGAPPTKPPKKPQCPTRGANRTDHGSANNAVTWGLARPCYSVSKYWSVVLDAMSCPFPRTVDSLEGDSRPTPCGASLDFA